MSNDNRTFAEYLSMTEPTEILSLEILEALEISETLKDKKIVTVASLNKGELASFIAQEIPEKKRSANKIAQELMRLFYQDELRKKEPSNNSSSNPEIIVKFPESPEIMSLSELLNEAITSPDKAAEYLPYISDKPLIQTATAKSDRLLVLVNGKLDLKASLDRINHLAQPYTREQRPDRGEGQKFVTLSQGLGIERPVYFHPLDGLPITGEDEAGYDYSKLDPDIAKSIIWARTTNHPLLPADLNKATVGASLFADVLVTPFDLILADYWNAIDAKEVAATTIQFETSSTELKKKAKNETRSETPSFFDWRSIVENNAGDCGKRSGVNQSLWGIYHRINISGVDIYLDRVVVLNKVKISGTDVRGTIVVPSFAVEVKDSGINNSYQVERMSWEEIANLYDLAT